MISWDLDSVLKETMNPGLRDLKFEMVRGLWAGSPGISDSGWRMAVWIWGSWMFVDEQGFRIIWRSLCTLAQTLFLRSGFGPQGDDEFRSQELRVWETRSPNPRAYSENFMQIRFLEWSGPCLGSRTLNKVQIIARSLKMRSLKRRVQRALFSGISFWCFWDTTRVQ